MDITDYILYKIDWTAIFALLAVIVNIFAVIIYNKTLKQSNKQNKILLTDRKENEFVERINQLKYGWSRFNIKKENSEIYKSFRKLSTDERYLKEIKEDRSEDYYRTQAPYRKDFNKFMERTGRFSEVNFFLKSIELMINEINSSEITSGKKEVLRTKLYQELFQNFYIMLMSLGYIPPYSSTKYPQQNYPENSEMTLSKLKPSNLDVYKKTYQVYKSFDLKQIKID